MSQAIRERCDDCTEAKTNPTCAYGGVAIGAGNDRLVSWPFQSTGRLLAQFTKRFATLFTLSYVFPFPSTLIHTVEA